MFISEQIVQLSHAQFWVFFGLAVILSAASFFFAFHFLHRTRMLENTPTAKIRSAQQGYLELAGTSLPVDAQPLIAPLSGRECCWFRIRIDRRSGRSWRTRERETSHQLFILEDETGKCLIDPDGAEVTPGNRRVWYGNSQHPTHQAATTAVGGSGLWALLNTDIGIGNRYRYIEELILPHDQLYAIGLFRSLDDIDHQKSRSEMTVELLRTWKRDRTDLHFRFDRNRDGQIDQHEWAQARAAAQREATNAQQRQQEKQIPHTLGASGSRSHPFLLSALPEFTLIKRFRRWAALALLVFFVSGGIAVFMLRSWTV